MKVRLQFLILLFCSMHLFAYEIPDENEYITETCRIKVKIKVLPDEKMEKSTGRALVTATLTDDEGYPKPQIKLMMQANAGTFLCKLPEDTTNESDTSPDCFTTTYDGTVKLYLVNIPHNKMIKVTASSACGDNNVSGYATMSISRGKAKRKKRVTPRVW